MLVFIMLRVLDLRRCGHKICPWAKKAPRSKRGRPALDGFAVGVSHTESDHLSLVGYLLPRLLIPAPFPAFALSQFLLSSHMRHFHSPLLLFIYLFSSSSFIFFFWSWSFPWLPGYLVLSISELAAEINNPKTKHGGKE